jgi:hypothetical protein
MLLFYVMKLKADWPSICRLAKQPRHPFSKPASNEQSRAIHRKNDIHLPAQPSTNTSNITAPCPHTNRNSYRKRNTHNLIDRVVNDKQSGGTKQ